MTLHFENNVISIKSPETEEVVNPFKDNYKSYQELGGILNEKDCQNVLDRMRDLKVLDSTDPQVKSRVAQGTGIATFAKIELNSSEGMLDPKIVLYVILRGDTQPEGAKHHHSQMSDQQIFGETLRMLGDVGSLEKLIKAYPNISFR